MNNRSPLLLLLILLSGAYCTISTAHELGNATNIPHHHEPGDENYDAGAPECLTTIACMS